MFSFLLYIYIYKLCVCNGQLKLEKSYYYYSWLKDFLKVWSERFPGGVDVWVLNNLASGNGDLHPPAQGRHEGNRTVSRNELIDYGGIALRLTSHSSLRGGIRVPGDARGIDLAPTAEFVFPAGSRAIRLTSSLAPGAFQ